MDASSEIKEFENPELLITHLEEELGRIRTLLGEYLRRLEDARQKAEKMKKAQEAIAKLSGDKQTSFEGKEIILEGLSIYVNPAPKQEMVVLEDVVKSVQDKINYIQKIRKAVDPLTGFEEGITRINAIMVDNIPIKINIFLKT